MSLLDDMGKPRTQPTGPVVAVVLAAGRGERFGSATKQLAVLDDRPLIAHAITTAIDADVDQVVVVVGYDADAVAAAARTAHPSIEVVYNPDHAAGQSTSLVAGIDAAAQHDAEVAVVLLADQPRVQAESVTAVVDAVRAGDLAARARYTDGPGHPVAFARPVFDQLRGIRGDIGARAILTDLGIVSIPVAGSVPRDVDEPADLERLHGPS